MHDHSFLTYALVDDIFISGGKEGGRFRNTFGLGCSLKTLDLGGLLDGNEAGPVEWGVPSRTIWKAKVRGDKVVVCLIRDGKPYLEIWRLGND